MRSTDYWRVTNQVFDGVKVTPDANNSAEQFLLKDDPEWRDLLIEIRIHMVLQRGGVVWLDDLVPWGDESRSGYGNHPRMEDIFKICRPSHREVSCGRCAVPLEDDWFLFYVWYPGFDSVKEWDMYRAGEVSVDEFAVSYSKANRECHIDGYEKMGYDLEELIRLDQLDLGSEDNSGR